MILAILWLEVFEYICLSLISLLGFDGQVYVMGKLVVYFDFATICLTAQHFMQSLEVIVYFNSRFFSI